MPIPEDKKVESKRRISTGRRDLHVWIEQIAIAVDELLCGQIHDKLEKKDTLDKYPGRAV